jgi:hypothetical protein
MVPTFPQLSASFATARQALPHMMPIPLPELATIFQTCMVSGTAACPTDPSAIAARHLHFPMEPVVTCREMECLLSTETDPEPPW